LARPADGRIIAPSAEEPTRRDYARQNFGSGRVGDQLLHRGLRKTKLAAVIDPGDEADRILAAVRAAGLKVTYVLLTHAHFDHIGAAMRWSRPAVRRWRFIRTTSPCCRLAAGAVLRLSASSIPAEVASLAAGQEIGIGELTLRVLHTPGHSPGHVTFYAPAEGALFAGDVLSPRASAGPTCRAAALRCSCAASASS